MGNNLQVCDRVLVKDGLELFDERGSCRSVSTLSRGDEGDHHLPAVIGDGGDDSLAHFGMSLERRFDLRCAGGSVCVLATPLALVS